MSISRRTFTRSAGVAIAGAGFALSSGKALAQTLTSDVRFASAESFSDPLRYFTKETFEPFLGTVFRSTEHDGVSFRLVEITDHSTRAKQTRGVTGKAYSLFFRQVGRGEVKQAVQTFDHPSLGKFSLMTSSVGRSGRIFEAVINHLSY